MRLSLTVLSVIGSNNSRDHPASGPGMEEN